MNWWRFRFLKTGVLAYSWALAAFAILNTAGNHVDAQVIRSWEARYNGPGNGADEATAMVLDGNGNVYVTGGSQDNSTGMDYATVKYSSAGLQLWVSRYNGPGNGDDYASSIALDSSGNIYVTGKSFGTETDYDYATVKYDSAGAEQWVARYNGPGDSADVATSIAVDEDDNVYVTGYSWGEGTAEDYTTIKYDRDGSEQWVARYNNPLNYGEFAFALVIDTQRNVCVTGTSYTPETSNDWATVKYDSSGVQQWVATYTNTFFQWPEYTFDVARDIAVDGNGNVSVTGSSFGYSYYDFETIKYNSAGSELWQARWDGWNGQNDEAYAIALDHAGNVLVAGSGEVGNGNYVTIKYTGGGSEQWEQTYDAGTSYNCVLDVTTDLYNCVYITGSGQGTGSDYVTIKYSPAGSVQWVERYNGPGDSEDGGKCVAVDVMGNVNVTGSSTGNGTGLDYATIRYSPTTNLTLDPINPPIQIPAFGGVFDYSLTLTNNATSAVSCDVWCMAILPNDSLYGPVLGPVRVRLEGSATLSCDRSQTVPGNAPAGGYTYCGYTGIYPDAIWNQDSFIFVKLATGQDILLGGWVNSGEPFETCLVGSTEDIPIEFALLCAHPNPFNPTTTINFALPEAARASLNIYDVSGQRVTTLVDGWRTVGLHQVTFDGSNLASGIYIYRLEAGKFAASGKMVLIK